MNEIEAEHVVRALASSLNWQWCEYSGTYRWSVSTAEAIYEISKIADIYPPENRSTECEWLLTIGLLGKPVHAPQSWACPCTSSDDAKALCENFIHTGDTSELDRLHYLYRAAREADQIAQQGQIVQRAKEESRVRRREAYRARKARQAHDKA